MSETYRIRITGYDVLPVETFLEKYSPHPDNPKIHTEKQEAYVDAGMESIGIFDVVSVSSVTGYYIDGHLRLSLYELRTGQPVPFIVTDLDEAEHYQAMTTLDYTAGLAGYDRDKLADAMAGFNSDNVRIQQMTAEMAAEFDVFEAFDEAIAKDDPFVDELGAGDVPDALWPTDNEWGIPLLDVGLQADALDLPVGVWGFTKRASRMRGTWFFYVDDYRFSAVWDNPAAVVNTKCVNAVEPNYSTSEQMPLAVGLWGIYRKRWLARYWQSQGIRVFVDMNVSPKFRDMNLWGVPEGWKAYATRGSRDMLDLMVADYEAAAARAGDVMNLLFVVYGGGKDVETFCKERGWLWVDEVMTRKRKNGTT